MLTIDKNQKGAFVLLGDESEVCVDRGIRAMIVDVGDGLVRRNFEIGDGAVVKLLRIATAQGGEEVEDIVFNVGREANLSMTSIYLGNASFHVNISGKVQSSHSRLDLNVLYFVDRPEDFRLRVRNDFIAGNSSGAITIRGVVANSANVEIFGEIGIHRKASGTNSRLDQHALIFGKGSRVRQLPILEINTNDVRAGHGATVSRIQEEELFYFRSRGISKEVAYTLAVNGFLSALLTQIDDFGEYYDEVLNLIAQRTEKLVRGN